jgi:hypothetical protein
MSGIWKRNPVEQYSWFFLDFSSARGISVLFTLMVITLSSVLFILYGYLSDDPTPDSFVGYTCAITGTLFMLLATLSYGLRRRSRKRSVGRLNGSLHWHISFGMIAIVLLFLHSFGNFNPRTGTYALYSMIALVISGITGRVLDRIVPKLIAHEVKHMLTKREGGHVELHTYIIQSTAPHNKRELRSLKTQQHATQLVATQAQKTLTTAGDLADISLEETPQETRQDETHDRIVPEHESDLNKLVTLPPDVQIHLEEHLEEHPSIRSALHREEYYRAIIRYWRIGHIVLALVTLGLTLWHLEYVAALLLPTFFN